VLERNNMSAAPAQKLRNQFSSLQILSQPSLPVDRHLFSDTTPLVAVMLCLSLRILPTTLWVHNRRFP
jgi:hypothetical protein